MFYNLDVSFKIMGVGVQNMLYFLLIKQTCSLLRRVVLYNIMNPRCYNTRNVDILEVNLLTDFTVHINLCILYSRENNKNMRTKKPK